MPLTPITPSGGAILGKGGAAIQSIAHESGAKISMTSKEEALFTHERIVSISGTAEACKICTSLVIGKLMEGDVLLFFNKGKPAALVVLAVLATCVADLALFISTAVRSSSFLNVFAPQRM